MSTNNYYEELMEYGSALPIIDSHEHIPRYEGERKVGEDVIKEILAFYYIRSDLIMAGMPLKLLDKYVCDVSRPLLERWNILEPYWKLTSHTGYARVIKLFAKDLYGIDHIGRDTIEKLNEAYCKANKPGHFREILKEKCNIEYCVVDRFEMDNDKEDRSYYRGVYRPDIFISPKSKNQIEEAGNDVGMVVENLDDWLRVCETSIDKAIEKGVVGLKTVFAYYRPLLFDVASKQDAQEYFEWIYQEKNTEETVHITESLQKVFENYMMHYVMKLANERKMVFQFHTGILAGSGEGHILYNSDPSLLCNLFKEYRNVKFDLLHMGFPYEHTLTALAKMFPNVYLNMSWAHIISSTACINILNEWLDSVPANKIIVFGGDHEYIDPIYGHVLLAKMHVCKALVQKIEEGISYE